MSTVSEAIENAPAEAGSDGAEEATAKSSTSATPKAPQRRGDVCKCPVCGSAIDSEAFYCAQCHNYFCFHCRARLLKPDPQLECRNQNCEYYAKLVCSACDRPTIKEELPSVFVEPLDGYWPVWLVLALVVWGIAWYYSSFIAADLIAIVFFVLGGLLIHRAGVNIFGGERRITEGVTSTHYSCLRCQEPVREVPPVA